MSAFLSSPSRQRAWGYLPGPAVCALSKPHQQVGRHRLVCKQWLDGHDANVEVLCLKTWPDLEHLSRMLARMPNLKVVDLTKLGADPTGYNSLEQIVELLAARPQLVDLRLGAHALPVLRAKQQSFGSSEAGKLHLRVRLPQSLALLKALQTLHLRRECCLGPDYKKLDLAMEAGPAIFDLPSLKHLALEALHPNEQQQQPAAPAPAPAPTGGLAAFQPCLPNLESLVLDGYCFFDARLAGLLQACGELRSLELHNVLSDAEEELEPGRSPLQSACGVLQALGKLEGLTRLKMDSYTFDAHSKELLVHLTALQELRHLDLAGALWELPDNYTQLAQLTHLALPSCGTFGEEIAALKELRVLTTEFAHQEHMVAIPDAISMLQHLSELALPHHNFGGLPAALGACSSLRSLNVTEAGLRQWPVVLGQLTGLTRLVASCNPSMGADMPADAWQGLQQLEVLELSYAGFPDFTASFTCLTRLKQLLLAGNALTALPQGLQLPLLEQADLQRNSFSEVPPQLQHSPLLADLDLGQQCSNPEAQPERLNVLVYSHCQDLPAWLLGLEQLRKLQVDEHPLVRSKVLAQLKVMLARRG